MPYEKQAPPLFPPQQGRAKCSAPSLGLKEQVSHDLQKKIAQYHNFKRGIKDLSFLMGIHEKTLKRLIDCENRPGYQTLLKIYRVLYQTNNDTHILKRAPEVIRNFLLKAHPKGFSPTIHYTLDIERELRKNPIFCEIYLLCGAGGTTREFISYQYGRYGEDIFNKMVAEEVIAPQDQFTYILGRNQASLSVETLANLGVQLIERFFKPSQTDEMGENYISFFTEGLNAETYQKWLEIDKEAFQKKIQLSKNPQNKGDIKSFTFGLTDTLIRPDSPTRH